MDSEKNDAKKFAKDLDHQIAGGRVEVPQGSKQEYDGTVQFAGKMLESRVTPSESFKQNLKEHLLFKLAEEEIREEKEKESTQSFWDAIKNMLPRSPALRAVIVTATIAVIVLVTIWRSGIIFESTNQPILGISPPTSGISQGPVEVEVSASQTSYKLGEQVSIVITFKNTGNEELTLTPFPPEIIIAATSLKPYKTIPGEGSRTLLPGETTQYTVTWDQRDDEGKQVPTGDYVVEMLDIELNDGKGTVTLPDSPRISIVTP
jgi:hypothetical protein